MEVSRKEFDDLRNLVLALVKRIDNDKFYDSADKDGFRQTEGIHGEAIESNSADIADNRTGIEEAFEASLVNADDIADVRTAIEEVYEMIEGGE